MKKIIAFISALTIFAGAVSCIKKPEKSANPKNFTAESLSNVSYKKTSLPLPDDMNMIYRFCPFNNNSEYFIVGSGSETVEFWTVDSEFSEFRNIGVKNFDYGISYDINITENGTIVVFVVCADHGDMPEPDYDDPTAIQQYEDSAEYSFRMRTYSLNGEMLTDNEVTDFPTTPGKDLQISGLVSDGETVVVCVNSTYELFRIDGSYIGTISTDSEEYVENIGRNDSGSIVCAVTDGESFRIDKINSDGTLEKSSINYTISGSVYDEILPASGDYSMYFRSMSDIYGVRKDDSSVEPLFSVNRSGLTADKVAGFAVGSDGSFIIPVKNYSNWSCDLKKFIPCDPEELENIPHITIGAVSELWMMTDVIDYFNETHDDFQIDVKTYLSRDVNDSSLSAFEEQITQDALSGNLPDVLILDNMNGFFGGYGSFGVNLIEKEALCDMLDFMENDDILNEDSFVPAALNSLIKGNQNGHAYVMPYMFDLNLGYVGKTKFVGDLADNWGFDAYMDLLENKPDGMGMRSFNEGNTKYDRIQFDWYKWIDIKNATCRFDSPEFIRHLKYCGEGEPVTDDYYSYPEMTEEEIRLNDNMFQQQYINDKAILSQDDLYNYRSYLNMTKGKFGGEPITILGDVFTDGHKPVITTSHECLAITKNSENKEDAWEFVKFMLSDEYYKNFCYSSRSMRTGFPVTKSGRELLVEYSKAPQSYDETIFPELADYTGYTFQKGINPDGTEDIVKIGEVTDEMIAVVDKLIDEAVPYSSYDFEGYSEQTDMVSDIYHEETERFFNGEITAEQCAELLQNRISLYLSEQFG